MNLTNSRLALRVVFGLATCQGNQYEQKWQKISHVKSPNEKAEQAGTVAG